MDKESFDLKRNSEPVFKIMMDYMKSANPDVIFKKTELAREIAYQFVEIHATQPENRIRI